MSTCTRSVRPTSNSTAGFTRPLAALYHLPSGYSIQGVKFSSWDGSRFVAAVSSVHDEFSQRKSCEAVPTSKGQKHAPTFRRHPHQLEKRGGPTHRIELIPQTGGKRYWIRRNGKPSTKVPEATASQIAERIRRWLVENT